MDFILVQGNVSGPAASETLRWVSGVERVISYGDGVYSPPTRVELPKAFSLSLKWGFMFISSDCP
jgi:hypothetical protein